MTSDQQFYLQMAAIIVGAVITITGMVITGRKAGVAAIQGAIASQSAQAAVAVSVENSKKADTLIEKATEIHTLANSTLSNTTARLDVALKEIDGLKQMVAKQAEDKAIADRVTERAAAAPPVPPPRTANQRVGDQTPTVQQGEVVNALPVPVEVVEPPTDHGDPPAKLP